ncbi:hypothetical protein [Undibacterium curvum]|uniref:Uncharacterized protein n=1 Tax=Undibacterium curvum TaxID=2762294 RepID=A0ABR7A830_9BURK|nr:hypothetical protein [Undibacterium curvum]MBC3933041.1 hypothetical protein [Undibacterium curvum]
MPIELRRSFQITTGVLGLALSMLCYWLIRDGAAPMQGGAALSLSIMFIAAVPGFQRLLVLFLPLLLVKLFPRLDRS